MIGTTIGNSLIWDNGTNVGIGNTNTSYTLDVSGTGYFSGIVGIGVAPSAWYNSSGYATLQVGNASLFGRNSANSELYLSSNAYDNTSGNPTYITTDFAARYVQNDGVHSWLTAPSGTAGTATTFTERMRITQAGNVGIGTSSPTNKLTISNDGNSALALRINDTNANASFLSLSASNSDAAIIANGTAAIPLDIYTGGVARMRITSGGYTKMTNSGSYNSASGTYHEMVQNLNNYQSATITHTGTIPYGLEINFANTDPNNATNWGFGFYAAAPSFVWIYRIYSNGTVAARSDARWKKNIETTRNGYLEDLCKLRVVKYNWYNHEEDAPKELGLIAQEVEEVFPNLISYDKVTTKKQVEQKDGTFIEQEFEDGESRSVKISVLPFMLLKGLQEAMTKIEEQQIQIQNLQEQINILAK